jgi:hypothetical protein
MLYLKPQDYARFAKAIVNHGGKAQGSGLLGKERALMRIIDAAEKIA